MPRVEEGMHQRKLPGRGSVCMSGLDHFCGLRHHNTLLFMTMLSYNPL
jgi:hypothetical protein